MAARLTATVMREGLREYYDPNTGEGLGARDFAWTSLILRAGRSGVPARS